MLVQINSVRIDFIPDIIVSDLDLARCKKFYSNQEEYRGYYIRTSDYTIRYTATLNLQVWLKNVSGENIKKLYYVANAIRIDFNQFKKSAVTSFQEVKSTNIQGSGHLSSPNVNLYKISKDILPSYCMIEAGDSVAEPAVNISNLNGQLFRYVRVVLQNNNVIRIVHSGAFTLICKSFEEYKLLLDIIKTIDSHVS